MTSLVLLRRCNSTTSAGTTDRTAVGGKVANTMHDHVCSQPRLLLGTTSTTLELHDSLLLLVLASIMLHFLCCTMM